MKRTLTLIITTFLFGGLFILSSCKNDDKVAPYITVQGDNPLKVVLNSYFDPEIPGAIAQDNKDKDISSRITVTHDVPVGLENGAGYTKEAGTFTVNYTVEDDAGNSTTESRTVKVANSLTKYTGAYSGSTVCSNSNIAPSTTLPYNTTVSPDSRTNWKFRMTKLSNLQSVKADFYLGRDEDGQVVDYVPGGYRVSIIESVFTLGASDTSVDTVKYTIIGATEAGTGIQLSKLDTTGTKLVYTLKYSIEREYPYDPDNPGTGPIQNATVTETVTEIY